MSIKDLKSNAERFAQMDVPMSEDMGTTKWQQGRYEGYIAGATTQNTLIINKACDMFENYIRSGSCTEDYVACTVKKFRKALEK